MKNSFNSPKYFFPTLLFSIVMFSGCQRIMPQKPAAEPTANESAPSETNVIDTSGIPVGQPIPQEVPITGVQPEVQANNYRLYDPLAVEEVAKVGKVVLFFHAQWCPTCKVLNEEIAARLAEIPRDVVIFKVDYDSYSNLKTQYGITYQHTLVLLDADLNEVKKWNGGDLDHILTNVQ